MSELINENLAIEATNEAARKSGEFLKSQGIDTDKGDTRGKAR